MLARMAVFTGISELMEASHSYGSNSPLVSSNSLIQVPLLASIASDHDFKGELNTTIVYPRYESIALVKLRFTIIAY